MPRIRRRSRRNTTDYTDTQLKALLTGHDFFGEFGGQFNRKHGDRQDEADDATAAMGCAWDQLRDSLLPEFVDANPGERPWAWWQFDAPEPRRMVCEPGDYGWEPHGERLSWGVPRGFVPVASGEFIPLFPPIEQMYESQRDYLARLGLLTEEELRHLA